MGSDGKVVYGVPVVIHVRARTKMDAKRAIEGFLSLGHHEPIDVNDVVQLTPPSGTDEESQGS
jgi:hypothetical protein